MNKTHFFQILTHHIKSLQNNSLEYQKKNISCFLSVQENSPRSKIFPQTKKFLIQKEIYHNLIRILR